MKGLINSEHIIVHVTEQCVIYLLKAYSPINSTVSPQGFSLNQILHKLNKIKKTCTVYKCKTYEQTSNVSRLCSRKKNGKSS